MILSHLNKEVETKQAEQYFAHTEEKEDQHRDLRHDSTQKAPALSDSCCNMHQFLLKRKPLMWSGVRSVGLAMQVVMLWETCK